MAHILSGTEIARQMYDSLKNRIDFLHSQGKSVVIQAVLVGSDPSSIAYLGIKKRVCEQLGIGFVLAEYEQATTDDVLLTDIDKWNKDSVITGIIVQLPLPTHINRDRILSAVNPQKDIDAFFYTLGQSDLSLGVRPPAAAGMMLLIDKTGAKLKDLQIVVVGYGLLVGQPLVKMLRERNLHPTIIDSNTKNHITLLRQADVILSGVGQPWLITRDMIKDGVIIIDAGYAKVGDTTVGDCDPLCETKASYFTRAIGGVGPLTVSCLLDNAVYLAERQAKATT